MKKITLALFIVMVTLNINSISASEFVIKTTFVTNVMNRDKQHQLTGAEADLLIDRLKEIRSLKSGNLSAMQKHELRIEVIRIKEKLDEPYSGGGIYISAGALLLIIILLIIFR